MWEWLRRLDWADIGFAVLLIVVIGAVLVAAWWPTRHGNGQ